MTFMKKALFVILALLATAILMYVLNPNEPSSENLPASTSPDTSSLQKPIAGTEADSAPINAEGVPKTLSIYELCTPAPDKAFQAIEEARIAAPIEYALHQTHSAAGLSGLEPNNYQGIDRAGLDDLVAQGDMGAMFAISKMERQAANAATDPSDRAARFDAAAAWAYKAAIHGKLDALTNYGLILAQSGKTAPDLGWISEEAFNALSDDERRSWSPPVVYTSLIFDLAPEFGAGPLRIFANRIKNTNSDLHDSVREQLKIEYFEAIAKENLSSPAIIDARFPTYIELMDKACE